MGDSVKVSVAIGCLNCRTESLQTENVELKSSFMY